MHVVSANGLKLVSPFNAGTGKGGTSIWGKKFEDTFHESLKVSKRSLAHCLCTKPCLSPSS